jgi:hypothetical protein
MRRQGQNRRQRRQASFVQRSTVAGTVSIRAKSGALCITGWGYRMSDIGQTSMDNEHREFSDEHATWAKETSQWQTEHQEAMSAFGRLEGLLRAHSDAVRTHAEAISVHERSLGDGETARTHAELAARHAEQRELLTRIAARHDGMMTQLRLLLEAIPKSV